MKHKIFLLLSLAPLILVSCKDELHPTDSDAPSRKTIIAHPSMYQHANFGMPFTDHYELIGLHESNPEKIIDYRVARYLATVELIAGANTLVRGDMYNQWLLTPYPKVVFDYDNIPLYYEFGYYADGEVCATIITYAQKEIDGVIAFISGFDYSEDYADMRYYATPDYPYQRYYGYDFPEFWYNRQEKHLEGIDFELSNIGTNEYYREQMFSEMDSEDIDGMNRDLDEYADNGFEEFLQEKDEFWYDVDNFFQARPEALTVLWDEETEPIYRTECVLDYMSGDTKPDQNPWAGYVSELIEVLNYAIGYYQTYTLPEYQDPRLLATRWTEYCGPAACAWVYRGKSEEFEGYYLPLFGDYETNYFKHDINYLCAYYEYRDIDVKGLNLTSAREAYLERSREVDNGLAGCFYEESVPFWWKGKWTFPLYHGGLNRGFEKATRDTYKVAFTCSPYKWITQKHEPVIIAINCDHYIVAFGTGVTLKKNGKVKDKFFAVVDNGTTTRDYSYHPYMRKHNGWNLHYGLKYK